MHSRQSTDTAPTEPQQCQRMSHVLPTECRQAYTCVYVGTLVFLCIGAKRTTHLHAGANGWGPLSRDMEEL